MYGMSVGFATEAALPEGAGPDVESAHWGYMITERAEAGRTGVMAAAGSKFFGAILMLAAGGLWVMPGALLGAEMIAIKLAVTVMFGVFGAYMLWAGDRGREELQVDTTRGELRFGHRDRNGGFQARGMLSFDEVVSVFLTRSKDRTQPTRLFLRVEDGQAALEIAQGDLPRLDALRDRMAYDLTRNVRERPPVDATLARHGALAL